MVKIIGISGGSGSGKTTIVRQIAEVVPDFVCIAQDSYYKSAEFMDNQHITAFNFDHPSAFDTDLMVEHLRALKRGESIEVPVYDFVHHRRSPETVEVAPRRLVLFEGIMVFVDPRGRELLDLKLYVDTPDDIRFIRRLERDIKERGRTLESVIRQYLEVVRPGHLEFIEPTKAYADLIIPEGGNNEKALQVLASFMQAIR
ncbi:MAG TPA: uridine kinase [Anaerolineales bacterium]|nr:uridine kinase [Anaerolineales bacterium]